MDVRKIAAPLKRYVGSYYSIIWRFVIWYRGIVSKIQAAVRWKAWQKAAALRTVRRGLLQRMFV